MNKLKMHSPNIAQENVQRIRQLFPGCVTEALGANGELRLAIDFDQLRQELADSIVDGPQERYQLTWPGKREALLTANSPIAKTLRPCRDESVEFDSTRNLFIEGDNLEALKLLQETYLGRIKMIYIDPPYNTGNDFIYDDDFSENTEAFLVRSNQKNEDGIRLTANTESNGRFHSDWMSMMLPRLKLARNLLADNGVIYISIDSNELSNLNRMCDEVFGRQNFVGVISTVRSKNGLGSKTGFATNNDFLLVYGKSIDKGDPFLYLRHDQEYINRYDREDGFGKFKMDGIFRKKGDGQRREDSPGCFYPIYYDNEGRVWLEEASGRTAVTPKLPDGSDGRWIWSPAFARERLHRLYASQGGTVYVKDYLHDAGRIKPKSVLDKNGYTTEVATEEIKEIFGFKAFDTPKPTPLLIDLIDHGCGPGGLHVVSCGKQHCHWGIAGANGLAGRCLSLDMRR
ncbi:MAG: site-specific DNA-methyltransferase [Aquabacterium sp.]